MFATKSLLDRYEIRVGSLRNLLREWNIVYGLWMLQKYHSGKQYFLIEITYYDVFFNINRFSFHVFRGFVE